jgi:hypothetical protein
LANALIADESSDLKPDYLREAISVCLSRAGLAIIPADKLESLSERICEWKPIEVAPKDGRSILAIWRWGDNPENGAETHMVVRWCGWWDAHGFTHPEPTHWMPLPEPPNPTGEGLMPEPLMQDDVVEKVARALEPFCSGHKTSPILAARAALAAHDLAVGEPSDAMIEAGVRVLDSRSQHGTFRDDVRKIYIAMCLASKGE